jgi:hypothetical protein
MKPDERDLLRHLVAREAVLGRGRVRESLVGYPIASKRAWYLLGKWCDKGWYEYGCTIDLGWFNHDKLPPEIA